MEAGGTEIRSLRNQQGNTRTEHSEALISGPEGVVICNEIVEEERSQGRA